MVETIYQTMDLSQPSLEVASSEIAPETRWHTKKTRQIMPSGRYTYLCVCIIMCIYILYVWYAFCMDTYRLCIIALIQSLSSFYHIQSTCRDLIVSWILLVAISLFVGQHPHVHHLGWVKMQSKRVRKKHLELSEMDGLSD